MTIKLGGKDDYEDEGNMKYWYKELPFVGEGVDLILARRVWSIIYFPLFFLSSWVLFWSVSDLIFNQVHFIWWLSILSVLGLFWSGWMLKFIWMDA